MTAAKPVVSSLRHKIEAHAGSTSTLIRLSGNVDESADFAALNQIAGPLVLDLGELHRINSVGVREWIHFVRDREIAGVELTFERVSPVMVSQMTMISNFMGARSRVKSVLVPYVCLTDHAEKLEELSISPDVPLQVKRNIPCPKCGHAMELDELPETYEKLLPGARVMRATR